MSAEQRTLIMVITNEPDPEPCGYLFHLKGEKNALVKLFPRIRPVIERQLTVRKRSDVRFTFKAFNATWEYAPRARD